MHLTQRTATFTETPNHTYPAPLPVWIRGACFACLLALAGCISFTGADPSKRTIGEFIDDEAVERAAMRQIKDSDPALADSHINVVSHLGVVLLTGEVATAAHREKAEAALADIRKVRMVHNDIQLGGHSNFLARANDTWLATKVMTGLATSPDVKAANVKVVAEGRAIYLVGVVPRAEGSAAAEIARTVFGVSRVVKVFDYLD